MYAHLSPFKHTVSCQRSDKREMKRSHYYLQWNKIHPAQPLSPFFRFNSWHKLNEQNLKQKAACTRQHALISNCISCSNVKTPKHLWWKNTRLPDTQSSGLALTYSIVRTNWLLLPALIRRQHSGMARPRELARHKALEMASLEFHLATARCRVSITMERRQEGKQQNKHCVHDIRSGRRNVPITCPVWQLRFRKCKQCVLFQTTSHEKRNPCSAVDALPSAALSGSLCHRSSPGG